MSDFLIEWGKNPNLRKLITSLGLPAPLALRRGRGAYVERPLESRHVVVAEGKGGRLGTVLAHALAAAGASPGVAGNQALLQEFSKAGEAFGRPARHYGEGAAPEDVRADALVFDATGIEKGEDLDGLYRFFHPWIARLSRRGRVIVIGTKQDDDASAEAAACARTLDGFARSIAKEVGRKGATAHAVWVEEGAEWRLEPLLRFLLSDRSAFLTGQTFVVSDAVTEPSETPFVRPLDGKVALVTGAARGIGKATAQRLADEGAKVICLDRPDDDAPLSEVARKIGGVPLLVDVTDPEAPEKISAALKTHGGADVVVHNAGVTRDKTLKRMDEARWQLALDINLRAVIRITERLLKDGTINDGARIVGLSSVVGLSGNAGQTNYSASKSGLIGAVEAWSRQLAERGIAVNAIAPGFIETRLTAAIPVAQREGARRLSALSQGGLPLDVAEAITFFSTPGAHGVTGQVHRVCGGMLVGA